MSDLQTLAADVLAMFALQRDYFTTKNPARLVECKQCEARLKKRCKEIVEAKTKAPSLRWMGEPAEEIHEE